MQRNWKRRWQRVSRAILPPLATGMFLFTIYSPAYANPAGGSVTTGSAVISAAGSTTTVTQTSDKAAINWQSFSIGQNETVRFVQPSASAVALNRVIGSDASSIYGTLSANGKVFLINPNGILFAPGSQVSAAGLVASTLNMTDNDFLNDRYVLSGNSNSVVNQGSIAANNYVVLAGPSVANAGTIAAKVTALGAGGEISLDFSGDKLLTLTVNTGAAGGSATNSGRILADGGTVMMDAGMKNALLSTVVNNTGLIRAQTVNTENGAIKLLGNTVKVAGTLDASAPAGGNGGFIETSGQTVDIASSAVITTAAAKGKTGTWLLDPTDYTIGSGATGSNYQNNTELSSHLDLNNVVIATDASGAGDGNIYVNAAVSWASGNTLTLSAHKDISINAAITATGDNAGLALNTGGSGYTLGANGKITLSGRNAGFAWNGNTYYVINSYTDPTVLETMSETGSYLLGEDWDAGYTASAGFIPIGSTTAFNGVFDGGGHTISNLTINRPTEDAVGMFTATGSNAVLRNLTLSNVTVSGKKAVGGLVAANAGAITNVKVSGSVSAVNPDITTGSSNDTAYAGGIAAINQATGSISDSSSSATVKASVADVAAAGGIAGFHGGAIAGSCNTGAVTAANAANVWAGGISGVNYDATVENSHNRGTITATSAASGAQVSAGGITGYHTYLTDMDGEIAGSYNVGIVTATGDKSNAGGIAGINIMGLIEDTYNTGTVTAISNTGSGGNRAQAGGIAGLNAGGVSTSYSSGVVSASGSALNAAGALIGTNVNVASGYNVANSYWDVDTAGVTTAIGAFTAVGSETSPTATNITGLTSQSTTGYDSVFAAASYGNFDSFNDIWYIVEGQTRPFLKSEFSTSVTNAHQLQLMSMNAGWAYTLANHIDMSELTQQSGMWRTASSAAADGSYGFAPLGSNATPFTGSFDGNGYTINGLTIYRPGADYVGLFGYTGPNVTISNVGLTNSIVTGKTNVGGLVGRLDNYGKITGSYTTGTVTGIYNGNTINDTAYGIGGLVGIAGIGADITDSSSRATVTVSGVGTAGGEGVGGLVGKTAGSIRGSYFAGSVNVSGPSYQVGGLAGYSAGFVKNSYNTAAVQGDSGVGGLVGSSDAVIETSYNNGNISGTSSVGGLAGIINTGRSITNSYNSGTINGTDAVGGLAGDNWGAITTSYSLGMVTGTTDTGALVGYNTTSGSLTDSYWNASATAQTTAAGVNNGTINATVRGLTAAAMKEQASYAGAWDFSTVWRLYEGQSNPLLKTFLTPLTVSVPSSSVTYNGQSQAASLTYSTTPDNSLLKGSPVFTAGGQTTAAPVNAGSYTLSGLYSDSQQGYDITYSGTLTIAKAPLTVTANNATRQEGNLNPAFTATYSGLATGDTAASLGALTITTTATASSPAGQYAIVPSGLTEGNYAITYVNGVLTVTPSNSGNNLGSFRDNIYRSARAAALQPAGIHSLPDLPDGLLYTIIPPGLNLNSLTGIGDVPLLPTPAIAPAGDSLNVEAKHAQ